MITLGSRVRDTISGYQGIATGRTVYLNGCVHVHIAREAVGEKGEVQGEWFDEQRVETVQAAAFKAQPSTAEVGGPAPAPPRHTSR